jgi:hypothetical protein
VSVARGQRLAELRQGMEGLPARHTHLRELDVHFHLVALGLDAQRRALAGRALATVQGAASPVPHLQRQRARHLPLGLRHELHSHAHLAPRLQAAGGRRNGQLGRQRAHARQRPLNG